MWLNLLVLESRMRIIVLNERKFQSYHKSILLAFANIKNNDSSHLQAHSLLSSDSEPQLLSQAENYLFDESPSTLLKSIRF